MKTITLAQLNEMLSCGVRDFSDCLFDSLDLSGRDLSGCCFDRCDFRGCNLTNANLTASTFRNAFFCGSILRGTLFIRASLHSADLRGCDMTDADISGADMYSSALQDAKLDGLIYDENTRYFAMRCPEKGAFIGWKVCYGRRVVMLLVPEDAQRVQGTHNEVRVDKAKVLTIKSVDLRESYADAHAYVDENFVYKKGEMVYAVGFNPDRFADSAGGIHIWLSREEAVAYLG
ncbi:MAG: pentapeptide repeat-containing protein [Clostridia bacterium]|nr:pentapeptide repeat-containing protein [Clostridia bacterium]